MRTQIRVAYQYILLAALSSLLAISCINTNTFILKTHGLLEHSI